MEDFGWIWALGGLLVGAGTMFGWAHWHKPQILTVASRMVEAKMSPEAIQALASGDPPTVIQIKVGDETVYEGPVKEGKIVRRRLKLEGKDARLIDEFGRDRG